MAAGLALKKVPTTTEVYAVIWSRHGHQLVVFGTRSYPTGNWHGDPSQAEMYTEWGFKDADAPLMAHRSSWTVGKEDRQYEYWLFATSLEDFDD